jgi:hypothetical protein
MFADLPNIRTVTVERVYDPGLVANAFERAGAAAIHSGVSSPLWRDDMRMHFDAAF